MLNRRLCRRCLKAWWEGNKIGKYFLKEFDKAWKKGKCTCTLMFFEDYDTLWTCSPLGINEPPPENCPYTLEHVINA